MTQQRTNATSSASVTSAEDFHRVYADMFNSGKADAVVSLYEPDATFIPRPDQVASGHAAIREALARFQAVGRMAAQTRYCITSGDVALASAAWRIEGTGADGQPVDLRGTSADLLRRQPDGRWLLVVDHPQGGEEQTPR